MSRKVQVGGQLKFENRAQEVLECLNRSGGTLAPGDVVIFDRTNSTATELYVTTTTSLDDFKVAGMVLEAALAANGSPVKVLRRGLTDLLKVNGATAIARGDKLSTFSTAKIAAKAASGSSGIFAVAHEAYAVADNNGVIDAYVDVGRADSASAGGNTLDGAYDQGGVGAGRTINATDGAVVIQNTEADTTNILEITKSPSAGAAGAGILVTVGANATGAGISFANSGTGADISGTSATWTVSKAGLGTFANLTCSGTITGGTFVGALSSPTISGDVTATASGTTGSGFLIDGSTITTGNVLRVEGDAVTLNGGFLINATIDGASRFRVAEDGGITIQGTASTDEVTITTGHLQITSGDIDVDSGKIEVDTATDQTSYVKRNQGVTTGPVVEIEETNVAADNPCLLIDHNPTGAINALQIQTDGTGYGISIEPSVAGGNGLTVVTAASGTGRAIYVDGTTGAGWLGVGTIGLVEISNDGIQVADATLLHIRSSGQPGAANDGICLEIVESGAAQATSYAVRINSTNNAALHVDNGVCLFDSDATFAGGATISNDQLLGIGTGQLARFSWETVDANANELLLQLPAGGGTNVPVLVIGVGVENVDLGLFNGVVSPLISHIGVGATTTGPVLDFRKARGTVASPTVCTTGDDLMSIRGYGCVAAGEWVQSAEIRMDIAGTIATTRGPGTITFLTATDAAPSVLTQAMIINADQTVTMASTLTVQGATATIGVAGTTTGNLRLAGVTSGYVELRATAAAGSVTFVLPAATGTNGQQLTTDGGTPGILSWSAAGSSRLSKDIHGQADPKEALALMLATPVHRFHYREDAKGPTTQDFQTEYVGVVAEEASWAMHYGGQIVNPVNTIGYSVLAIQALKAEIDELRRELAHCRKN